MLLLAILGCAGSVTIDPGLGGCENSDLDNPDESKLVTVLGDGQATVTRTNAYLDQLNLSFSPEITADDGVVHVREAWAETEDTTESPFCYAPFVTVTGERGEVQVRWYLEGENTPFDTVNVEL